jgi:hypothetical protein
MPTERKDWPVRAPGLCDDFRAYRAWLLFNPENQVVGVGKIATFPAFRILVV